jgi:hypothetical protein
MAISRRQLLTWGSAAGGLGLAFLGHRLWAGTTNKGSSSSVKRQTSAQPIGPKGMFAPPRGDVRLAVISDLNSAYGSTHYEAEVIDAIARIPEWQPDIVLCSGDMVAGQSLDLTIAELDAMWQGFERYIGSSLRKAKLPFGFTVGNHDASSSMGSNGYVFAAERQQTTQYWNNPRFSPGLNFVDRAEFPFNYTFQQKGIFYIVWDASSNVISKSQLAWVEKSLASAVAQQATLRIAIGHLPLYPVAVGRDRPGEFLNDSERLRQLLEQYKVHTYISGHGHAYYPAYKGKLQLLNTGALGAGPRRWLGSNLEPMKTLTIVDVHLADATTTYTTYNMTTLKVVDQKQLPRAISGPEGLIVRRDVKPSELSAAQL